MNNFTDGRTENLFPYFICKKQAKIKNEKVYFKFCPGSLVVLMNSSEDNLLSNKISRRTESNASFH